MASTSAASAPVSLVVVNSTTGDWRLDVLNPFATPVTVALSVPLHPDGDETGRTWTSANQMATGLDASGSGEISTTFTLDARGRCSIFGRSTFANVNRVTVSATAVLDDKTYTDYVHFFPTGQVDPKLLDNDVDMPVRFFDQESFDQYMLDGLYNHRFTMSWLVEFMREHANDSFFSPDGLTIQVIDGTAVVNMANAVINGLAENSPIPVTDTTVGLGIDLEGGSLHPINVGGLQADIADLYANDALLASSIGTKQPSDPTLTALAGVSTSADTFPYFTGTDAASVATVTAAGRAILDDVDAAAQRTTLGLGTAATTAATDYATAAHNHSGTYQPADTELTAIAGLTSAADKVPYFTGSGTAALADFTAAGRALMDDADASAQRTTLGLGTAATTASTDYATAGHNHAGTYQPADSELTALAGLTSAADKLPYFTGAGTAGTTDLTAAARTLLDDADVSTMRTTLGLAIGTNVQAYDAELAALAGLTSAADKVPYFTGSGTAAVADFTAAGRALMDDASASAQRTTLDVVDSATAKQETFIIAISDETTAITTGTAKVTWRMPFAFTVTAVRASLTTASSSGIPTFDINEGGTTILSTKLTIDANELTSTTAATAAVISDTALADDAEMTIDVDVAGTGAKGAKIYIIGTR